MLLAYPFFNLIAISLQRSQLSSLLIASLRMKVSLQEFSIATIISVSFLIFLLCDEVQESSSFPLFLVQLSPWILSNFFSFYQIYLTFLLIFRLPLHLFSLMIYQQLMPYQISYYQFILFHQQSSLLLNLIFIYLSYYPFQMKQSPSLHPHQLYVTSSKIFITPLKL